VVGVVALFGWRVDRLRDRVRFYGEQAGWVSRNRLGVGRWTGWMCDWDHGRNPLRQMGLGELIVFSGD